jgi:hypothetical protein
MAESTKNEAAISPAEDLEVEVTDTGSRPHFFRPAIICGICEACGTSEYVGGEVKKVTNKMGEIEYQYKGGEWKPITALSCKHYKGLNIQCAYCGEKFTGSRSKLGKFTEVLSSRQITVMSFEDQPKRLIMCCDDYECRQKNSKRIRQ